MKTFAWRIAPVLCIFGLAISAFAQEEKKGEPAADTKPAETKPAETKPAETKPMEEEAPAPRPVVNLGPKFIRLHLQDNSIVSGDLSISEITVETEFGKLVVPVEKIRSFTPGLGSNTKAAEELKELIAKLSSDDYKTREQAHKDLAGKGVRIQKELEKFVNDENAEVKRHVTEILKEIEEASAESEDDEEGSSEQPWLQLDTIVTADFTVLGKVSPAEFEISTKFGPLKIALGDIAKGERVVPSRDSIRKNITIDQSNLAQRGYKSTGIKVQVGDKITIKADGSIVMSPWGSNTSSTPDGMPNYGWFIPNQIPGGALCARIGDKGQPFKVGRSLTMVVKQSGTLQLAIGMQAEYSNEGYQFPGDFKVKLKVDPK